MTLTDHPTPRLVPVPDTGEPDSRSATPAPRAVAVRAWWDPRLATTGHELRGAYVERYWLGVLGPSVVFLLRRFARGLDEHPAGFRVDLADTARALGLGSGTGRNAPIVRSIDRACNFGAMRRIDDDTIEVRTHLPSLTPRQLSRLPLAVRRSHDAWMAHPSNGPRDDGAPPAA